LTHLLCWAKVYVLGKYLKCFKGSRNDIHKYEWTSTNHSFTGNVKPKEFEAYQKGVSGYDMYQVTLRTPLKDIQKLKDAIAMALYPDDDKATALKCLKADIQLAFDDYMSYVVKGNESGNRIPVRDLGTNLDTAHLIDGRASFHSQ
jgi:hypothetical protein